MSESEQILFGGLAALPARVAEFEKAEPGERPLWVELLEKAFSQVTSTEEGKRLYGDPDKGATLEQAWRASALLTGKLPVCLISTDQPAVPTDAIDRVVKMNANELVKVLSEVFGVSDKVGIPILYYDGHIGHSVCLMKFEKACGRFDYHDPWPNYSLLCKDYNAAGIDAQPQQEYGWSITSGELVSVILAAFVNLNFWSEYIGERYFLTYDELKDSDFWTFFHLREIRKEGPDENGSTQIALQPGGFQSDIGLSVISNQKQRLTQGNLALRRGWIIGPPYGLNPFALDILRSFLGTLVAPPDRDSILPLIELLTQIANPENAKKLLKEETDKSLWHDALFACLDASGSFEMPLPLSGISINNAPRNGEDWLEVEVTVDAL